LPIFLLLNKIIFKLLQLFKNVQQKNIHTTQYLFCLIRTPVSIFVWCSSISNFL